MPENIYEWLEQASYEDILRRWRFAKVGDPTFFGQNGGDYIRAMDKKRAALPPGEAARISKKVGWG